MLTCNMNPETGIRYGIICVHDVNVYMTDDFEPWYTPPGDYVCPKCEHVGSCDPQTTNWGDVITCAKCSTSFDLDVPDFVEPSCHIYKEDGYELQLDSSNDIWVFKSPYTTLRGLCSPCAPNACHLKTKGDYQCYALGPEWFDDECKIPYKVEKL